MPKKGVRACTLCGKGDGAIVQTQALALLSRPETCEIDFAVCSGCGHLQQWPLVAPELIARHYTRFASYELYGDPEEFRRKGPSRHASRFLSLAKDTGLKPGRAYEIGCASAELLHQFRRHGWEVGGCDPSPSAAQQAQTIFGIDIDLGGEEQALQGRRDLDLILMSHVLEHLHRPGETLQRIHDALADAGHLLLEVPCAAAPDLLPPGWFTFEHLHYYQPLILEQMLRMAGFELLELRIAMTAENYPVMAAAARKAAPKRALIAQDPEVSLRMAHAYVARDNALWASTARKLTGTGGPIFLYGAGIHTAQLLAHTDLGKTTEILAIADRDPKKWGHSLAGRTVIGPQELLADPRGAPVVISSYAGERAIAASLLGRGMAPSRIRPLYSALPN